MSLPRATVRLQFHRGFTLDDARDVVGYYADLGISHFYASPLTASRPGSTHGYDVIDYDAINPELGGHDALVRLVEALRARGMGLVLDIVPNHMAASEHNRWWRDVLVRGRASEHADYFDIDWSSGDRELRDRVLLPVLPAPLDESIAEIRLVRDRGAFLLDVGGMKLPVAPDTLESGEPDAILAAYDDPARLRSLVDRQHYVLAHWRDAATRINWRRFFEIGDLVALRMDRAHVFEAVHRFVFGLFADGLIDGVRVDHIDGIADPRVYCERLREGFARTGRDDAPYIVVEKILARGERLRDDWRVDGTTGYDFMDLVGALLHDASGAPALDARWRGIGGGDSLETTIRGARRELATTSFRADVDGVVRAWSSIEDARPIAPRPDAATMRTALVRVLETFERYRTYLEPGRDDAEERAVLDLALAQARVGTDAFVRDAILRLGQRLAEAAREADPAASTLLRRFQQLTPPIAAKAVEDTAFYRYGRLVSRNEVGGDPAQLAIGIDTWHAICAARSPRAMLATATHDHKRGEDVRARLAVLSELADAWSASVERWRTANASLRDTADAPSPADEYMLYQTIVGAWPADLETRDSNALAHFTNRIEAWQTKAIREAKRHTSWIDPDPAYERACASFLHALLDPARSAVSELGDFATRIAAAGALNGLVQTLLRSTAPGVPDLYQGCERWDLSLVDPDNRRAVDYAVRREAALDGDIAVLASQWRDGRIKQALLARVLHARAAHAEAFASGAYRPLAVEGPLREHAIAFAREHADGLVVVLAARGVAARLDRDSLRMRAALWRDTVVRAPGARAKFVDAVSRRAIAPMGGAIPLEEAFRVLPLALLTPY